MRQNLIKSKRVLFLLMLLLVVGNNSCKKNQVAEATILTVDQLPDNKKVHPAEITNWIASLPVKLTSLDYNKAQQAVINGQHLVKIPINSVGNNSALFITKVNDSLKVYGYKWIDETKAGKKFTGKITSFSFQDYKDRMLFYNNGVINKINYSKANNLLTNKASVLSNNAKSANIFSRIWDSITEAVEEAWCWLTGGSFGLSDDNVYQSCNDQWSYGGGDGGGDSGGNYGGTSDNGTGGNYGGGGSTGGDPGYGSTGDPGYGGGNYVYGGGSSWTPTTGGPSPDQFSMYDFGPSTAPINYDPNFPFQNIDIPIDAPDDPIIDNGISVTDVSTISTGPPIQIAHTTNRKNTEDMTFGTNGDKQGINLTDDNQNDAYLFQTMTSLFHATTIFDSGLQGVGDRMINRFNNNTGGQFEDPVLNQKISQSSELANFLKSFGSTLNTLLKNNGGNINAIGTITLTNHPQFNGFYNKFHGLQILINDTEYTEIQFDNFTIAGNYWSGDVTVTIHDHFGLDKHDATTYQDYHLGFADWWLLQHTRGYIPFETIVHVRKNVRGQIN